MCSAGWVRQYWLARRSWTPWCKKPTKALTERTAQLETLSTKLSKYLAPQVYASIFQGRQQVEIASNRKKLTVFFSDIVGFTETTENLDF